MGVSKEYGVEVIQLHERRLDSYMFCEFLRDCKQLPNLKFVLFGDNAPIHTSNATKGFLNKNRLPMILNIYKTCLAGITKWEQPFYNQAISFKLKKLEWK